MPKFLIRRTETTYRDIVIEALDEATAEAYAETLDYDEFQDQQDLSSHTESQGVASTDDIENLPILTAPKVCPTCDAGDPTSVIPYHEVCPNA